LEIGKALKDAREAKGISLEAAEENTKIRRKYLEALEQENFEILPGKVYVKGFIKNYAIFLGLNAEQLVSAYGERTPVTEREDDKSGERFTHIEKRLKTGYFKWAAGMVLLAVVAYMALPAFTGKDRGVGKPVPDNQMLTENKPPAADQGQAPREAEPPAQQGVNLTLNVTDNTSWMYVEVDGNPTFTGFLGSGQVKAFKGAERIFIKLGNAGVVEVECNGQKIGVLGRRGEVVKQEFTAPQV
jgi:transcriptional regulator with XRE-family HTH domain